MAKQMVLNRKMYKEIKKMDHQDMSNYLSRYYMNAYNQGKEDSEGLKADELREILLTVKGIGPAKTDRDHYGSSWKSPCRKGVREMWQRGVECDGKCYTDEGICPRAEWCDKTRKGEFAATALAGFFFLVVLVMLAPGMIALKLLDWVYGKLYWREG